jgi:NTE family protein
MSDRRKTALVLSGGGMFGAWQAGAWRALAASFHPDLVVGASVGSLNGYAIAGGALPGDLLEFWRRPETGSLRRLPDTIRGLIARYPAVENYAVVLTDAMRMKPKIFWGEEVTWRHLAASCAVPLVLRPYRIGARWYCDGGLLNPVPVWAAIELGATRIVALNVLPRLPAKWLRPLASGFLRVAGYDPPRPEGIEVRTIGTPEPLGSLRDSLQWRRENIERWMEEGFEAAKTFLSGNDLGDNFRYALL